MKVVQLLPCILIFISYLLPGIATARDNEFVCSVTVDYQNKEKNVQASDDNRQQSLTNAVKKACLSVCNSKDIKSNCSQNCLKTAVFSKAKCKHPISPSLLGTKKSESPTPQPVDVESVLLNKAVKSLIVSEAPHETLIKSSNHTNQDAPLLLSKWEGNAKKTPKRHPLIVDTSKKKPLLLTPPKKKSSLLLK